MHFRSGIADLIRAFCREILDEALFNFEAFVSTFLYLIFNNLRLIDSRGEMNSSRGKTVFISSPSQRERITQKVNILSLTSFYDIQGEKNYEL